MPSKIFIITILTYWKHGLKLRKHGPYKLGQNPIAPKSRQLPEFSGFTVLDASVHCLKYVKHLLGSSFPEKCVLVYWHLDGKIPESLYCPHTLKEVQWLKWVSVLVLSKPFINLRQARAKSRVAFPFLLLLLFLVVYDFVKCEGDRCCSCWGQRPHLLSPSLTCSMGLALPGCPTPQC